MVSSFVVSAAAFEAGHTAFHGVHTSEGRAAFAAGVEEFSLEPDALEREVMAPGFVWDAQIPASLAPLGAMRSDGAASDAMLGKKMGKFVSQSPLNFERRDLDQLGIEGDCPGTPASEPGRCSKAGIPLDSHIEFRATGRPQEMPAELFQKDVAVQASGASLMGCSREIGKEVQMAKNGSSEVEHSEPIVFHHAAMGCAWRSTTAVKARRQVSMSESVVWVPRENLTVDDACLGSTPMATSTCDG